MASLRIIGLTTLAACAFGVIHDQVTARICVEYFTIGHVRLVGGNSPTVHGLLWGVLATWWVGVILGCGLALAARWGSRPKLDARDLKPYILGTLAAAAIASLAGGAAGYWLARSDFVRLAGSLAKRVPSEKHVAFIAVGAAHTAAYAAGFLGACVAAWLTWRHRKRINGTPEPT